MEVEFVLRNLRGLSLVSPQNYPRMCKCAKYLQSCIVYIGHATFNFDLFHKFLFLSCTALKHSIRRNAINSSSRRLSRAIASFVRSLAGINGGNVSPTRLSYFFFLFPPLCSFYFFARRGKLHIGKPSNPFRNGSFIGRVNARARALESARVGERGILTRERRAFPSDRETDLPFAVRSHA